YCGNCHSPLYVVSQAPLPAPVWAAEVEKMRTTYGAAIPEDDAQQIIQYLSEHYTAAPRNR
ncbi:MAG: sulfide dehydrogenase, partial [Candidatus Acidiferrales bacterium]